MATLPFYNHLNEVAGQTPINYQTLMDVNGGTNTTRYYASADVTSNGGIMQNTDDATSRSAPISTNTSPRTSRPTSRVLHPQRGGSRLHQQ